MSSFRFDGVMLVGVKVVQKVENVFTFLTVMDMSTYGQATLFYSGNSSLAMLEMFKGSIVSCLLEPTSKGFNCVDIVRSDSDSKVS